MAHRTVICVLLVVVLGVSLACSPYTQRPDQTTPVPATTGSTPAPVPAIPGRTSAPAPASTGGTSAPPLYFGDTSIEERISTSAAVVKARLVQTSSDVFTASAQDWSGNYYVAVKFHLTVSEYLSGSGSNSATAIRVSLERFGTQKEAEAGAPRIVAERHTSWDDREAILFLRKDDPNRIFSTSLLGDNDYFLTTGGNYPREDRYSLRSKFDRRWLPAADLTTTGDGQEFLLAVPSLSPASIPRTITLGELKRRVASVHAELSGGDGSKAYKDCIRGKYSVERLDAWRVSEGNDEQYRPDLDGTFVSGSPTGTKLYRFIPGWAQPADKKGRLWLDGRDAALFAVNLGALRQSRNGFIFDQNVVSARPIPAGTYRFNNNFIPWGLLDCGHTFSYEVPVTVTAPSGTLHEAFFDPLTDGSAIAADATNGILKPVSFTDGDGGAATIHRIAYNSGAVTITLTPHTAITGHTLEFIALDGSVSLSLHADNAILDPANNTLTWPLSEQPWHPGDKLMLRISFANP